MPKKLINSLFNKLGYKFERIRPQLERPIDVFDLVVRSLMAERGTNLTLIQVGANDGIRADPVRPFILQHHWKGLLIEPQPDLFARLQSNYASETQLRFENVAVGNEAGTATLYRLKSMAGLPPFANGLASFDKSHLLSHKHLIPDIESHIEEIEVSVASLSQLLTKHNVGSPDVVQIDTEGFDFEVVKMLDLVNNPPAVIQYEHFHLSPDHQVDCRRLLIERGYRLATALGDTVAIYKPE